MEGEAPRDFADLKEFILNYLGKNASQIISKKSKNNFTLSVLKLCRNLLTFGFYKDINEIRELLPILVDVLDGSVDLLTESDVAPIDSKERYKKTENTLPIMEAKEQICHILSLFMDLRLDIRMSVALKLYKKFLLGTFDATGEKNADSFLFQPQSHLGRILMANTKNNGAFPDAFLDSFDSIFRLIELDGGKERLVPVLLDLTLYEHPPLISAAINLLSRHHSQQKELLESLASVQILVDNTSIQVYRIVQERLTTLSLILCSHMNENAYAEALSILKQFKALCTIHSSGEAFIHPDHEEINPENQRLLRNLGAHSLIIELLTFLTTGSQPEIVNSLIPFCYSFLHSFVKGNVENQLVVFGHINLFLSHLQLCSEAALFVAEIFKNNRQICNSISEKHVAPVVQAIVDHGHFPRYLRILEAMVIVSSVPVKSNQNLVLDLLLQRPSETHYLFNTPEGQAQRMKLIEEDDHRKNPEGVLQYHMQLINLLASCSADLNEHTEAKCQALLSIADIVQSLQAPGIPKALKVPYLHFLDEVYASTEKKVEELKLRSSLWELFQSFEQDIGEYLKSGLRRREQKNYVFDAVLPLLANYYWKHYPSASASEEQSTISKNLADIICNLFDDEILTNRQKFIIFRCLCSFKKRGILPPKNLKKFEEIISANLDDSADEEQKNEHQGGATNAVSEYFSMFVKEMTPYFTTEGEFAKFVDVYRAGDPNFSAALINHLGACDSTLSLLSLKILKRLIDYEVPNSKEEVSIQKRLNSFGASKKVIDFICTANDDLVYGALDFGISLLRGGNRDVQKEMYTYLTSSKQDAFFYSIRQRIQRSKREIKEKRQIVKKREILSNRIGSPDEQEKTTFEETSYIQEVLRFLQLLCEGHNLDFQNFLRLQKSGSSKNGPSGKSIDIVSEVVSYLMELERNIDTSNIDIAIQLFETLTEFIQGPCSDNQLALVNTDLFNGVNNILRSPLLYCQQESVEQLKASAMKTLLGLLEGNHEPAIPKQMLNSLALKAIAQNMEKIYLNGKNDPVSSEWKENGFLYFMLLRILMDHDRKNEFGIRDLIISSSSYEYFSGNIGRIEIVRDKRLERVYFPILPVCRKLSEKSKIELLWEVDRTSPEKKIHDFFARTDILIKEMDHLETLEKSPLLSAMTSRYQMVDDLCFWLTVMINVLIVMSHSASSPEEPVTPDRFWQPFLFLMAFLHFILSVVKITLFSIRFGPVIIHSNWETLSLDKPEELSDCVKDLLHNSLFLYTLFYLIASFFGNTVSYYFFALHLYDIIAKNRLLQKITQSVTSNAQQLLLTALLGFVIIYHHTIFASLYFREDYVTEDGTRLCDTMLLCLANTFYLGLTSGGMSGELQSFSSRWYTAPWDALARFLFDMSYFIIVITILLNIVFGIIIDTFADQRDSNNSIKEDIENNCFICNISRDDFDRKGEGFEKHIKNDHNAFQYLYFLVYLRKKDPTEYTGPESYISKMLEENNVVGFFPIHMAMCLQDHGADETSVNQLYDRINVVESNLEMLDEVFKGLLTKVTKLTAPQEEKMALKVLEQWTKVSKKSPW